MQHREPRRDHRTARVLDARQARRALDPRCRSSRTPRACTTSRRRSSPRRGTTRALRDEALVEGAVGDAALPGRATAELVDVDLDERRPRAGPRSEPRRCPLRARRARGRRAARRRGAGPRRSTARTRAAGRRRPRRGRRTALRRGREPRTRLVVRGPNVTGVRIERIDAGSEPAQDARRRRGKGRRYVEDRDTAAVVAARRTARPRSPSAGRSR